MGKIILNNWREGLEKVTLTKLQIDMLGKSLQESKRNVDSLLEGNKVIIDVEDKELAVLFIDEAEKIGVSCEFIST